MVELPESIYIQTLRPVVTVIGGQRVLEQLNKQVISSSFDQRMDYESLEFNYNFEIRRDAKVFDKYVSQGILKLSWTTKCRKFVPACILLVFDWSGQGLDSPTLESPDWKQKETTILKTIRKFKEQCKGRLVKIAVLCLLGSSNEDLSIEEKLSSLKKNSEIDTKGLVLARQKLEDPDSVSKLKKFLWEGCISHYKDEIDRIKKLKSRAHKELNGNLSELQIRYNFKLGYYSELRQDKDVALNFYKKSYKEVQESQMDPSVTLDEKRSVADLISHRIQCILLSAPHLLVRLKEAITLFKAHLTSYKLQKSSGFEAFRWLSEHFSRFGSLVEKVPPEVYEKDNFWTHPGFYFQTAGVYYMMRMKMTVEDADFMQSVQNWQVFISTNELRIKDPVYIGQYKTLASHPLQKDMIEGMSVGEQVKVIKILEEAEINHLTTALEFMFKALKFYKGTMPMTKISLFLSFLLAGLYKKKGESEPNYQYKYEIVQKIEGWNSIQEHALDDLIQIAESSNKVDDLMMWALKLLEISSNNQEVMLSKLNSTLNSNLIHMKTRGIIQAKAKFDSKSVTAYSSTSLTLTFISNFQVTMQPVKVSLIFSEPSFNCDNFQTVTLEPNKACKLTHNIVIRNQTIQLLQLEKIIARYEPYELSWVDFEIDSKAKLTILSPQPQLSPTFNHLPPALIGENYVINIKLHPYSQLSSIRMLIVEENKETGNRRRAASIDRDYEHNYSITYNESPMSEDGITIDALDHPAVLPLTFVFYEEKSYVLKVKFLYNVHKPNDICYKWEDVYDLDITVQPPFNFKLRWNFLPDPSRAAVFNARLWNMCSSPIYLYKILLLPETEWESLTLHEYDKLEIDYGNSISENFDVRFLVHDSPCVLNGFIVVTWSRKEGVVNDCRIPLQSASSTCAPIDLIVHVGNEFTMGTVFEMKVYLRNKTKISLEGRLVVEESQSFLMGGVENVKVDLKEEEEKCFSFSLVGFECGMQELPKVVMKMAELTKTWTGKVLVIP